MNDRQQERARYDARTVESKWQRTWEETGIYRVNLDTARRPFYNLMEFPYPSGEGLHVGHVYTYSGADTYGRFRRMHGDDVFQPMGFDAFGIHAENYALRLGINPAILTPRNVERFREEQMKRIGVAFNWERAVDTTNPRYYRWTQWIFLQLYKAGLAYRAEAPVNWCPSCLTTLADEQVIGGACERCDTPVIKRRLTQWFFRITHYADRLLDFSGAEFTDITTKLQTNWIGRQEGAEIRFPLDADEAAALTAFSTRADTLYGATYMVLAPEHPLLERITAPGHRAEVQRYVQEAAGREHAERLSVSAPKSGVFTGAYARNPVDGRRLPIWVAEYVLMDYGTGVVFGVPAHDQRDLDFARAHDLPIIPVVAPLDGVAMDIDVTAYTGEGTLLNSDRYNGLPSAQARRAIVDDLQAHGLANHAVTYRLRDWLISRQRYWGPPIPMLYCERCGVVPVPEEDLPVLLPQTEHFHPLGTGQSPLASIPGFVHTACPTCGGPAQRETDVSDNFLDSAWYYLRYTSTEYDNRPWDAVRLRRWLPVSQYLGGVEHSTLHHLYARFLWKALQDLGHLPVDLGPEPFARLRLHGTIIRGGRRMSKSRGNVVNPDEYVARYGADVLRVYLLFMGPFERGGDFSDSGIRGVERFLDQVWRMGTQPRRAPAHPVDPAPLLRELHQTIQRVTDDIGRLALNTAIAALMGMANTLRAWRSRLGDDDWDVAWRIYLRLLAPLAPHAAEEVWAARGWPYSVHTQPWPEWDPRLAAEERITLVVQVNGRVRARIEAHAGLTREEAQALAVADEGVQRHLDGGTVRDVIYVPDRLVNLVLG